MIWSTVKGAFMLQSSEIFVRPGYYSLLIIFCLGGGWVGSWTILTAKLQYPRSDHLVIRILMDKENCKLNGKMSLDTTNAGDNTNHGNVKNGR